MDFVRQRSVFITIHWKHTDHGKQSEPVQRVRGRNACPVWRGQDREWKGKAESKNQEKSLRKAQFLTGYSVWLLLWEGLHVCGEVEIRQGLSGTKSEIPMICLAKRVREKWIKAQRDQRNATVKSTRLPREQQEMHMISKLFFSPFWCWRIDWYCWWREVQRNGAWRWRGSPLQEEEAITWLRSECATFWWVPQCQAVTWHFQHVSSLRPKPWSKKQS